MIVTIQRGISGLPYSVNKQEFATDGLNEEQVVKTIEDARKISDMIEKTYGNISPLDIQLAEDNKKYKEIVEMLSVQSEQKSVFIRFLKDTMEDDAFMRLRDECVASNDYQKITAHTNAQPE